MKRHALLITAVLAFAVTVLSEPEDAGKGNEYSGKIAKARELRLAGDMEQAEKIYSEILAGNHRDVDALIGRGMVRLRQDSKTAGALEDFKKVIVLSPGYIEAYVGAVTCCRQIGDKEQERNIFDAAKKACADDTDKIRFLADTMWNAELVDYARELEPSYRDKLTDNEKRQAEYKEKIQRAAELRTAGKHAEAEKLYSELLAQSEGNVDALLGRGMARLRQENRAKEALDDFKKVIMQSPGYVEAYVGAVTCCRQMIDKEQEKSIWEDAKKACAGDAKKTRYLADMMWNAELVDYARELEPSYMDKLTAMEKKQAEYKEKTAKARELRLAGELEKAEQLYSELIQDNHRNVDALLGRAQVQLQQGKADEALDDYKKIIVLSPGYIEAYVGAASCYRRMNSKEQEQSVLEEAKKAAAGDSKKTQFLADTAWTYGHYDFARTLDEAYKKMVSPLEKEQAEYRKKLEEARDLRLKGYTDDAEKIYQELLDKNERDVDALCGIAFCRLRDSKRLDEALEDFKKVIVLSPGYVDAYIGAAICYKRLDKRDELRAVLDKCYENCRDDEGKTRYLATSAWREGYFPLARKIDDEYKPASDRVLIKDPSIVRLTYAHSWVEQPNDWDEIRIAASHRPRPDISLDADYDHWWRYGESDFNAGFGVSYRYDHNWSGSYDYEMSDNTGFLAEQRHNATLQYRLFRRLYVYGGPRFARYDGDWSRRGKIGATTYWKNFYADASFSAGRDTSDESVSGYSVSAGYNYELRYALSAGYSRGEETVEFIRGGDLLFRTDDVDAVFVRGSWYFTETSGISVTGLQENRNSNLFRRELSVTLFKSF